MKVSSAPKRRSGRSRASGAPSGRGLGVGQSGNIREVRVEGFQVADAPSGSWRYMGTYAESELSTFSVYVRIISGSDPTYQDDPRRFTRGSSLNVQGRPYGPGWRSLEFMRRGNRSNGEPFYETWELDFKWWTWATFYQTNIIGSFDGNWYSWTGLESLLHCQYDPMTEKVFFSIQRDNGIRGTGGSLYYYSPYGNVRSYWSVDWGGENLQSHGWTAWTTTPSLFGSDPWPNRFSMNQPLILDGNWYARHAAGDDYTRLDPVAVNVEALQYGYNYSGAAVQPPASPWGTNPQKGGIPVVVEGPISGQDVYATWISENWNVEALGFASELESDWFILRRPGSKFNSLARLGAWAYNRPERVLGENTFPVLEDGDILLAYEASASWEEHPFPDPPRLLGKGGNITIELGQTDWGTELENLRGKSGRLLGRGLVYMENAGDNGLYLVGVIQDPEIGRETMDTHINGVLGWWYIRAMKNSATSYSGEVFWSYYSEAQRISTESFSMLSPTPQGIDRPALAEPEGYMPSSDWIGSYRNSKVFRFFEPPEALNESIPDAQIHIRGPYGLRIVLAGGQYLNEWLAFNYGGDRRRDAVPSTGRVLFTDLAKRPRTRRY